MTGIIICDGCGIPFFAHGSEKNLPEHLKGLPLFMGVRKLKATEVQRKGLSGYNRTAYTKFLDLCQECERKERLQKR